MNKTLIVLTLTLCGCSGLPQFDKGNFTEAQMKADQRYCAYEADKAVSTEANPLIMHSKAFDLYGQCMQSKGYVKASASN